MLSNMINQSKRQELAEYILKTKYAKTKPNGIKESWEEAVDRIMNMHYDFLSKRIPQKNLGDFASLVLEVTQPYKDKLVLGAQRALQFGGPRMEEHPFKTFNCSGSAVDRPEFFEELFYIALNGTGVGLSVQKLHVKKLPIIKTPKSEYTYVIQDSIEGWADAVKALSEAYFYGKGWPRFDYSLIRPEGALVTGEFSAPGPAPLKKCLNKLDSIFNSAIKRKLTPFECCRMACLIADAVISGSIRRAALLTMFSVDDTEMMNAKTGEWWTLYPELGRSNNSAVILPTTPKEQYLKLFQSAKDQGEPGIIFSKNENYLYNPCVEVGMYPFTDEGVSGFSFCNLTEINALACDTEQKFYEACRSAAILGTFQAAYTWDSYMPKATIEIMTRDALLGVSMTGMCSNPKIAFDPEIQRKGARVVKETNLEVARVLGINPAARTTCIKPSGSASLLLGCSSGIHPEAFRRYIRHVQMNNSEPTRKLFNDNQTKKYIEPSYYQDKAKIESVAAFNIQVPEDALIQSDLSAIEFLNKVKLTQNNWIEEGTNWDHASTKANPNLRMNVSNTITVDTHEWDDVSNYLWENKEYFCGVSFLPKGGDLVYKQAPMTSCLTAEEMIETYGDGALLSSGLIMDGLEVFNNLWEACDAAIGVSTEGLSLKKGSIEKFIINNLNDDYSFLVDINGIKVSDVNAVIGHLKDSVNKKNDWVRRFKQFADNYFEGDLDKCMRCLKHVNIFYKWQKVSKLPSLDWTALVYEKKAVDVGSQMGVACSGGSCEII